jgi:chromosome segregation ATPase
MSTTRWRRATLAALLAVALASCAHRKRATAEQAPSPAQQTQQTFERAATNQEELAQAQRRLEAAREEVAKAQQRLEEAQRREEQERASVQELGVRARQDLERARLLADQAQAASEQAQGLEAAVGRVVQATPSRVLLQMQDGRVMSFRVDQHTRVLLGSEERSVAEIQQGADARVAYDPAGGEPTAITILLKPGGELGELPAAPAAPSPPAEAPAAPR